MTNLILLVDLGEGIYPALNQGMDLLGLRDGFVWFLNAGDCVHPDLALDDLQAISSMLNQCDVLSCSYQFIGHKIRKSRKPWLIPILQAVNHQAILFSYKIICDMRYDNRFKIQADTKFFIDVYERTNDWVIYNGCPLVSLQTGGVSYVNRRKSLFEKVSICKERFRTKSLKMKVIFLLGVVVTYLRIFRLKKKEYVS